MFVSQQNAGDRGQSVLPAASDLSCNGEDKKSFKSRRDWVIANWDWILACGEDFVASFDDWRKADDPFQFLAAARELYNYINAEGEYWSGLAIGLDATQSGVQHYAAASLSEEDGVKVNRQHQTGNKIPTTCTKLSSNLLMT